MRCFAMLLLAVGGSALVHSQTPARKAAAENPVAPFTRVFDDYMAALRARNFDAVLALIASEKREQLQREYETPERRKQYLDMAATMAPPRYETVLLIPRKDRDRASLVVHGLYPVPAQIQRLRKMGPVARTEILLHFVREESGERWTMEPPVYGGDPDQRRKPKDLAMGARSEYETAAGSTLRGTILRVERQDGGAIVLVVRMPSEEVAAFLPAALVRSEFVPGAAVFLRGGEHKSGEPKFWADFAELDDQ